MTEGPAFERLPGSRPAPRVVVSVHDVSPANLRQVRWLLRRLDEMGAQPRVLKVIPDEGDDRRADRDADLMALVRDEVGAGSEVVLHGYTHRTEGRLHGRVIDLLRARLFAARSAEFLSLSRDEAAVRVSGGLQVLAAMGVRPIGFCPPAWLADRRTPAVLRAAGLRYFVTFLWLHDLERRRRRALPPLGYMGASPRQERLVAMERLLVSAGMSRLPVARVFLHPQGASGSRACAAVLRTLSRLVATRTPVTYAALLDA